MFKRKSIYINIKLLYNEGGDRMSNDEFKIRKIIDRLRPFLMNDGGNVEFVSYEDNVVYIKMTGACANCHMLDLTLKSGIEAAIIEEVPEVTQVINIG